MTTSRTQRTLHLWHKGRWTMGPRIRVAAMQALTEPGRADRRGWRGWPDLTFAPELLRDEMRRVGTGASTGATTGGPGVFQLPSLVKKMPGRYCNRFDGPACQPASSTPQATPTSQPPLSCCAVLCCAYFLRLASICRADPPGRGTHVVLALCNQDATRSPQEWELSRFSVRCHCHCHCFAAI
jgi:hypothetical protein